MFPYSDEHDPLRICGGFRLDPISHLPGILRTKFLPRFITEANGMLQVDLTDQEIQQKRSQSTIGTYGPDVRDHVPVFWHPRNPATYRMEPEADEELAKFQELILDQDQPITESQRPEQLPIDLSAELHIAGPDQASIEYRRILGRIAAERLAAE